MVLIIIFLHIFNFIFSLETSSEDINGHGFSFLSNLVNLTQLDVFTLSLAGFNNLHLFPNLEILNLTCLDIEVDDIKYMPKKGVKILILTFFLLFTNSLVPKLTNVSVAFYDNDDVEFIAEAFPTIKNLVLESHHFGSRDWSEEDFKHFRKFTKLESLCISSELPIDENGFEHIFQLTSLTQLDIDCTHLPDSAMTQLSRLTNLKYV